MRRIVENMKLKPLIAALALSFGVAHAGQYVQYANVVSVTPSYENQTVSYRYETICRNEQHPVYGQVPIYSEIYHQNPREVPWLRTLAGALIGMHIAGGSDASRAAGALVGGSIANATSGPIYGQSIVGYTNQIIGYETRPVCENVSVPITNHVTRYHVVYEINGITNSTVLSYHPGNTLRLVTHTRVMR